MSDTSKKQQIKVSIELSKLLTPDIIENLQNAIDIPERTREETGNNPTLFLNSLKNWKHFNPGQFDSALQMLGNQTILQTARKLEWLSSPLYKQPAATEQPKSTETLVELLTSEMSSEQWVILVTSTSAVSVKGNEEASEMLKLCIDNNIITRDMNELCDSLELLERNDLAKQVRGYVSVFKNMTNQTFRQEIHNVTEEDISIVDQGWEVRLRKHMKTQNKDVSPVLDGSSVPIESVYTPLTVIKVKPAEERVKEESGINEIEFLRKIHKNVALKTVEVVDFEMIVTTCDPSESQLWCLIGSPGSGKSFLCKHFAHMYGTHLLTNFVYAISIQCRSQEWHKLEEANHECDKEVDIEFIVSWLSLCMPAGTKWSQSLSQHLLKSDGEGLFIILDGVDEFTRNVPFESTFLNHLLHRRCLTRSTILVTSRPGAWSELQFNSEFRVDTNYQVLGFSPENRDLYFAKRIETIPKLNAVFEMFLRHDEIQQLSLVPVNASLFSALFNETEYILSQTLSNLYTKLIVYIIRRQLSRMGLIQQSKIQSISKFHPGIRECVNAIGTEANQGIFDRELTSDKYIPLKIGGKFYRSERLGLMQAHIKVVSLGRRVTVWTFQHLTIQEYMAALSICDNTWTNQCFIVRYITSSGQYLSMYKMVVRFVAGILRQVAGRITPILCRHALPNPMPLHQAPMLYQLCYFRELVEISDWEEFTKSYILLCTVISEINVSIPDHFGYFLQQFPYPLYLYFDSTFSPNEWHCFLKSFQYVTEFEILSIQSDYVTPTEFRSLLTVLESCKLHYLALAFVEKDFDAIHSLSSQLSSAILPHNTRISIALQSCDLTACDSSQLLFSSTNQFVGSLCIDESKLNDKMLQNLTNRFSSLQNLFYKPKSDNSDWPIIHQTLTEHPQMKGLYIHDEQGYLPLTPAILSGLSSIQELYWAIKEDCYEILPSLLHYNSLTYLFLAGATYPPPGSSHLHSLSQLITENSNSLREIGLSFLDEVEFSHWNSFFRPITSCSNLMVLSLSVTAFRPDTISCWYGVVSALKSLVYLVLYYTTLHDSGMLIVCHSLNYHPVLRRLWIQSCELSSASCDPLRCLIQTLPRLKLMWLLESELSSPDPGRLQLLKQTAEECSVKIEFQD